MPSAYALDSGINEITFVLGPLLVAVLPAPTVVVVTGAVIVAASALLLGVPAIARAEPDGARLLRQSKVGRIVGPLGDRRVLTLLFLAAFGTFGFGALRIATAASAATLGTPSAAGVLMGLLSVGALIGALGYGARTWRTSSRRLLILVSAAEAGAMAIGVLAVEFLALSMVIVAIGLLGGVRDSVVPTLLADQTRHHHRTEVFAWLTTFMWIGYGTGTSLAGAITGPTDNGGPAFVLATAVLTIGVLLALTLRHTVGPPTVTEEHLP